MMEKYKLEYFTWSELKEAIHQQRVVLLPVGAIEPHGYHLPLDTDTFLVTSVCEETAKRSPEDLIVLPPVSYGSVAHVMDFPGAINSNHLTEHVTDIAESVAHHGFRKIILVNGHGSNRAYLEVAARKVNLHTEALCAVVTYWNLARDMANKIRTSGIGGMCHAGEFETSLYLYLAEERVDMSKAIKEMQRIDSEYEARDLVAPSLGPLQIFDWSSRRMEHMISGDPTLATKEKGRLLFEAIVENLLDVSRYFRAKEIMPRTNHHD